MWVPHHQLALDMFYFIITSWHTSPHQSQCTVGTAGVLQPSLSALNVITHSTVKCAIYINFREGVERGFHVCADTDHRHFCSPRETIDCFSMDDKTLL